MAIGPVEYMVVAFPGNKFKGNIVPALTDLVESGTVRIIDLAFVAKDGDGSVVTIEMEGLDPDASAAFQALQLEIGDLINEDDLMAIGEGMDRNTSAAVLIWEDTWATKFAAAIREANGVILDLQRIPHEVVMAALPDSALSA